MNYAELIEKLHKLPEAKQATVLDFVDFLVERNEAMQQQNKTLAKSSLANMMKNPLLVPGFTPLSREECNERRVTQCYPTLRILRAHVGLRDEAANPTYKN